MNKILFTTKAQIILIIFGFLTTSLLAGNIDVSDNTTGFKVVNNSYNSLTVRSTLSDINFFEVKTKEGRFTMLNVPDYSYTMYEGDPRLPVLKKLIEVPVGATINVTYSSDHVSVVNLADYGISNYVMPAQPSLSKSDNANDVDFIYNKDTYGTDQFYGTDLVKVVDLGIMRGVRIARIEISPMLYNPVQGKLLVNLDVEVQINFDGANVQQTIANKENLFSPFFEGIYQELVNYKPIESKELITDAPATYIIVADPMFESILQPFIEWKTKKGFNVVEAYTDDPNVGNTNTSIKSYLEDFYNNPPTGYTPQSFVLLVGDVAQIPPFNGTAGSHVTDLYFCEYTGDIYPECYYGRFSANNLTELQPQIDKTLEYEQYLFPDPSFLDEVVMVAGADASHQLTWGNGQINYGTENYFNEAHGILSHTYLQPEPGGANYSQEIHQNVSDGVAYANYTAHCSPNGWADPSFEISDIAGLSNAHKYCLMVGNCCSSVEFQTTCFGEEMLRAQDKGALGYIGGSNSTYWDEDYWWGVGFEAISANPQYNAEHLGSYDRTFHDNGEPLDEWYACQGQMPSAGNLAVTQAGGNENYYWEIYHLMGDPSLMVYFSQPPDATANYAGLMPLGSATFTVNTDPYALVAISKDGVLHGAAVADGTGTAEVTMFDPIAVPGVADVVITGQNLKPYIGDVVVQSPTTAYVLFDEMTIDDSNGNNNGQVDFSEYILLDVTLQNLGTVTGTNLVATLSTTDEYVTIDTDTHNWPDIAANGSVEQTGAFAFTVSDIIPDQHVVQFTLDVTDGTDTWNSTFNVTLNSPVLIAGSFYIDDSFGNNNGRLDPGETADIIISNTNDGGCDALNSIASAITNSGILTLNNATYDLETIASGETKQSVFNVTVDASAQIGDIADISYTLESAPYSTNIVMSLTIGLLVEDFETGDFSAYEWSFNGDAEWVIDEATYYEGSYSAKSGSIVDEQTSSLVITVNVTTDDQISFYRKVSSESNYDYLRFYIDGIQKDEWSGEVDWEEVSFPVTAGEHTFTWSYEKDYSVSSGDDCGWVDFIVFPSFAGAAPLAVAVSANPAEICEGESSQLNAFATGGSGNYTYQWSPTTGLNDPNIQNPVATPDETTVYSVVVNDGTDEVTGEVTLTVNPVPETPTVTQQESMLVSSAEEGNQWYDSNGIIEGATGQTYTPTATDDYYVIVTNEFGCESEQSNIYHFIYTGLIEISSNENVIIYPNPFLNQFTVDYSLKNVSKVTITVYDTYGRQVAVVQSDNEEMSGNHRVIFNTEKFNPGVYFCRIETNDYTVIKRIVQSK